jgi:predicted RNA-binding protein associated with RNAse of E/G family
LSRVRIDYHRPGQPSQHFEQQLVLRAGDAIITLLESTPLREPVRAGGDVVLEPGAPALWFTFPGAWHDVGRFHRADGRFTGWYANVLTPVAGVEGSEWSTTDLFLDVWLPAPGAPAMILDEAELRAALAAGHIEAGHARRARQEAEQLVAAAARGGWPPPVCRQWTLERARECLQGGTSAGA